MNDSLVDSVSTKFTTTIVGSISALERHFGHLWGEGKPRHELTSEELRWEQIKKRFKTEVMNLGHSQQRAAVSELKKGNM